MLQDGFRNSGKDFLTVTNIVDEDCIERKMLSYSFTWGTWDTWDADQIVKAEIHDVIFTHAVSVLLDCTRGSPAASFAYLYFKLSICSGDSDQKINCGEY